MQISKKKREKTKCTQTKKNKENKKSWIFMEKWSKSTLKLPKKWKYFTVGLSQLGFLTLTKHTGHAAQTSVPSINC